MLWEVDIVPVLGAGATTRAKCTEARIGAAEATAVAVAGGRRRDECSPAADPLLPEDAPPKRGAKAHRARVQITSLGDVRAAAWRASLEDQVLQAEAAGADMSMQVTAHVR